MNCNLSRTLRVYLKRAFRTEKSPRKLALSLCVGFFMGVSPFWGFHILIALSIAIIFKLNKLAAVAGTFINNPWTMTPIFYGAFVIGKNVCGLGDPLALEKLTAHSVYSSEFYSYLLLNTWNLLLPWGVGSLILGSAIAVISYYPLYFLIKYLKDKKKN